MMQEMFATAGRTIMESTAPMPMPKDQAGGIQDRIDEINGWIYGTPAEQDRFKTAAIQTELFGLQEKLRLAEVTNTASSSATTALA